MSANGRFNFPKILSSSELRLFTAAGRFTSRNKICIYLLAIVCYHMQTTNRIHSTIR
jgi:hypothetical protein